MIQKKEQNFPSKKYCYHLTFVYTSYKFGVNLNFTELLLKKRKSKNHNHDFLINFHIHQNTLLGPTTTSSTSIKSSQY